MSGDEYTSVNVEDWSLITGRGGGGSTKLENRGFNFFCTPSQYRVKKFMRPPPPFKVL